MFPLKAPAASNRQFPVRWLNPLASGLLVKGIKSLGPLWFSGGWGRTESLGVNREAANEQNAVHQWLAARAETAGIAESPPVLVIVHGLGEHAGRYEPLARQLNQAGWSVFASDLPGHGLQAGQRGDADYEQLLDHVQASWRMAADAGRPRWIWGHSFGGNLVVNSLLRRGRLAGLEGALVTGPMFRAALPIPVWKRVAAQSLSKLFPRFSVQTDIDPDDLTHDSAAVQAYRDDPLNSHRISARLGKAMLDSAQWALDQASQWSSKTADLPLTIWHGAEDRITSCDASKQFALAAGRCVSFEPWPGCRHELHHESQAPGIDGDSSKPMTFVDRLLHTLGPSSAAS